MNMTLGRNMREIPREQWPFMPGMESVPLRVWLSTEFMAIPLLVCFLSSRVP